MSVKINLQEWGTITHPRKTSLYDFTIVYEPTDMSMTPASARKLAIELLTQADQVEEEEKNVRCSNCDHVYIPTVVVGETCPKCGAD